MPIRNTAYETTACNGFVVSKVAHAIEDAIVAGHYAANKNNHAIKVINRTATTTPIPAFFHPMVVKRPNSVTPDPEQNRLSERGQDLMVVVDVRSSGKFDDLNYEFKIRNPYEYDFITLYGELNNFWIRDNVRLLSSVSHLPASLYARWMSENITRRFGLNPQDQLSIAILAAYFYLGQFTDDEAPEMREFQRLCGVISKSVFVNGEAVIRVIENRPYIKSIAEFCEVVKEVTGNVRLNDLNVGVIYSILGNSWYGTNAKELVAVAIEFPPAWILLSYSSYVDRSYKNTGIAKMSVRDKKGEVDSFIKSLVTLIR